MAFELVKRGHSVKVITAIPDYPNGRFYKGYSLFKRRTETINGVEVVRVPIIPRFNGKPFQLVIHYFSGIFFFFFYGLFQALFHKYDCVLVHDTSPAFIGLPAVRIGRIQKIPVYHWILDMWPESLTAGGITGGRIYQIVLGMMKKIYKGDSKILVSSHGFEKLLHERGVSEDRIVYLPNWSDNALDNDSGSSIPELPSGFIIMFAGNMGEAQNLENVLKVAERTASNKDIHWVFLGDGRKKPWASEYVKSHGLEDTVHLLGRYPIEMMPSFFSKAHVMLVSLKNDNIFKLTLPAKVQAYMAAGKPILGFIEGEGKDIIRCAECGWCCNSNDVDGMAETVIGISGLSIQQLNEYGKNGRDFYSRNFTKDHCIDILEDCIC